MAKTIEKSLALQQNPNRTHPNYDSNQRFDRPEASRPAWSRLYVNTDTKQWFEHTRPFPKINPDLAFLPPTYPEITEKQYETVLTEHKIPHERSGTYQTLFVAQVAERVTVTVKQNEKAIRIEEIYTKTPHPETIGFDSFGDFAAALGNKVDDIEPTDFAYFQQRVPHKDGRTGWDSTIRVGRIMF